MEPAAGAHRRHSSRGSVDVRRWAGDWHGGEFFLCPTVDPAEAAELALGGVEVAVAIAIARDEAIAVIRVSVLTRSTTCTGNGKRVIHGVPASRALDIEACRWRVAHAGLDQVVAHADQQVRLAAGHQVDVAHWPRRTAGQRRRPDDAGGTRAQQVDHGRRGDAYRGRELCQFAGCGPTVTGLVEVNPHPIAGEVEDVGGARAVDARPAGYGAGRKRRAPRTRARGPC